MGPSFPRRVARALRWHNKRYLKRTQGLGSRLLGLVKSLEHKTPDLLLKHQMTSHLRAGFQSSQHGPFNLTAIYRMWAARMKCAATGRV
jgi:hypothetical protein